MRGKSCELKKAGATRMGTNTFVGKRLEKLKGSLQNPEYVKQNYKDLPPDQEMSNCATVVREHKGGAGCTLTAEKSTNEFRVFSITF